MRRLFIPLLALALLSSACGDDAPRELAGIQRTPLPSVGATELPEVTNGGSPLSFVAEEDGLLLVYFGYTHCPDVCPTTLSDVRSALRKMDDDDAGRVELAMATIDPERDLDEIISGYVQSFVPNSHALRTTDDRQLRAAADAFGADYGVATADDGEIEVIHTGFLYVVDDEGQLLLTWPFGILAEDIADDLSQLLAETT